VCVGGGGWGMRKSELKIAKWSKMNMKHTTRGSSNRKFRIWSQILKRNVFRAFFTRTIKLQTTLTRHRMSVGWRSDMLAFTPGRCSADIRRTVFVCGAQLRWFVYNCKSSFCRQNLRSRESKWGIIMWWWKIKELNYSWQKSISKFQIGEM